MKIDTAHCGVGSRVCAARLGAPLADWDPVFAPALPIALTLIAFGNPDTPAGRAAIQRREDFEAIVDAMKTLGDELKIEASDMVKIKADAAAVNEFAPKLPDWFPAVSGPQDGIKTDALAAV